MRKENKKFIYYKIYEKNICIKKCVRSAKTDAFSCE